MYRASWVMYSIANFFTWIVLLVCVAGITCCVLGGANIVPEIAEAGFTWIYLPIFIVMLIASIITIAMVRKAKAKGTSKLWDLLFMILGIFGGNIFYFLGGIFGLLSRK